MTEFGIVRTLLERPGKVCSRDHLMNTAYELHKIVSDRTIDSHVRRVRAKFAAIGAEPVPPKSAALSPAHLPEP